jgi:ribulose 1,5-bisphosphate synthetase/thiazole synthase
MGSIFSTLKTPKTPKPATEERNHDNMDIIIVGAGIAGLSAGIGLRRAGHRITVRNLSYLNHPPQT